jgi:ubiquinone/menaquinone biosynthesis C-methylase UbiE
LDRIGVKHGGKAADFGCGTGSTLPWFARQVGPGGNVVGIDASASQLSIAERRCSALDLTNVTLVEADVYSTGLPRDAFDLVHCRLLLCHLQRPEDAIREMAAVTKPGGTVVCFDIDMHELCTIPRTAPYERLREIYLRRRQMDGLDDDLASRLPAVIAAAGLRDLEMTYIQPVTFRGEEKRFWEYTFAESAERTLAKGLLGNGARGAPRRHSCRRTRRQNRRCPGPYPGLLGKEAGTMNIDAASPERMCVDRYHVDPGFGGLPS